MSYGVRNTLLLLLFFLLLCGGGMSFIHFIQKAEIQQLELNLQERTQEFEQMSQIVQIYPILESAIDQSETFLANYNKNLFPTHNPDQIFRYLSELNTHWPRIEFNFVFNDSTTHGEYGVVRTTINGNGSWQGVYDFMNRIENSRPVQRISDVQISPVHVAGEYGRVNFNFTLRSYYDRRSPLKADWEELLIAMRNPDQFHNPFFPMIRDVDPNEDDLVDVESSRLLGVGTSRVYLRNQRGELVRLSINDQVWLGRLESINVRRGEARFRLNKGGIIEEVTLEVQ